MLYLISLLLLAPALTFAIDLTPYNNTALEIFDDIDLNGDRQINMTDIDIYFLLIDTDNDSNATMTEFVDFIDWQYPEYKGYESILYQTYDADSDGSLTKKDLENFFELSDTDNDLIITEEEYLAYFAPLVQTLETAINSGTVVG